MPAVDSTPAAATSVVADSMAVVWEGEPFRGLWRALSMSKTSLIAMR
jgi:hypothetical protein